MTETPELITPREAYDIASSWGSLMTNGDPGAVFYTFATADATPQGPNHRAALIAYTKDCLEGLAKPCYDDEREELKAELDSLLAFFEGYPDSGVETREAYADESAAVLATADSFATAYFEAALFTGVEHPHGHPDADSDQRYDLQSDDIEPDTLRSMLEDCKAFQTQHAALLAQAYTRDGYGGESQAGHDFWLTRNRHGAGFWDRDALDAGGLGDRLSDAAREFGEFNLYTGDDGGIYGS